MGAAPRACPAAGAPPGPRTCPARPRAPPAPNLPGPHLPSQVSALCPPSSPVTCPGACRSDLCPVGAVAGQPPPTARRAGSSSWNMRPGAARECDRSAGGGPGGRAGAPSPVCAPPAAPGAGPKLERRLLSVLGWGCGKTDPRRRARCGFAAGIPRRDLGLPVPGPTRVRGAGCGVAVGSSGSGTFRLASRCWVSTRPRRSGGGSSPGGGCQPQVRGTCGLPYPTPGHWSG